MVFRIGLQVVDVDRGETRNEQLQFLFIEDGDESFGNDVVEAFHERVELLSDGARHLHLTDQLDIFLFVVFVHGGVSAVWLQVPHFCHSEFFNLKIVTTKFLKFGVQVLNTWFYQDSLIFLTKHIFNLKIETKINQKISFSIYVNVKDIYEHERGDHDKFSRQNASC